MNATRAVEILGPHIQPGPNLSSVIEALGAMSKLGTPTDAERLEAIVWVQQNQKDYEAESAKRLAATAYAAR